MSHSHPEQILTSLDLIGAPAVPLKGRAPRGEPRTPGSCDDGLRCADNPLTEHAIDAGAADPKAIGDGRRSQLFRLAQPADFCNVHGGFPALAFVDADRLGGSDASHLPLAAQVDLELGELAADLYSGRSANRLPF